MFLGWPDFHTIDLSFVEVCEMWSGGVFSFVVSKLSTSYWNPFDRYIKNT